jgi:hypothetical protein
MKKLQFFKYIFFILIISVLIFSCTQAKKDWDNAKRINTIESYKTFITLHPNGNYSKLAQGKIDSCYYYQWPPQKIASIPTNFIVTSSFSFNKSKNVNYNGEERIAFLIREAKLLFPENIFSISKPSEGYAESQFGVVYYDDKQTFIEVDSTKNDELDIIYLSPGSFQTTHILPGTHIRYQNKIYELRKDGWYLDNIRIHEFVYE